MAGKESVASESCSSIASAPDFSALQSFGEGRLATLLRKSLAVTIKKYIESVRFSWFQRKYAEINKDNSEALKTLYKQLIDQLQDSVGSEIGKMCEEENIGSQLDELDEIVSEYSDNIGNCAWRPSGDPSEDMRDHIYDIKLKHKAVLQKMLTKLDQKNERILVAVKANHEIINNMHQKNKEKSEKFTEAVNSLRNESAQLEDTLCSLIETTYTSQL